MIKAMLKGNKKERKRRRKDGMICGPQMGFTNIFWNPLLDCVCIMLTHLFLLAKFHQKVK
jgi:hypothetical protein